MTNSFFLYASQPLRPWCTSRNRLAALLWAGFTLGCGVPGLEPGTSSDGRVHNVTFSISQPLLGPAPTTLSWTGSARGNQVDAFGVELFLSTDAELGEDDWRFYRTNCGATFASTTGCGESYQVQCSVDELGLIDCGTGTNQVNIADLGGQSVFVILEACPPPSPFGPEPICEVRALPVQVASINGNDSGGVQ